MPIYEYECQACQHQFEEMQKMSDPPIRKCPECGRRKVQRLVSASAFTLKGGGWYKDLYSSTPKGGSGSSSSSGSGGGGSSETSASSSKKSAAGGE